MPGLNVLGRVARLALESNEDVEVLERTVSRATWTYGVEVARDPCRRGVAARTG